VLDRGLQVPGVFVALIVGYAVDPGEPAGRVLVTMDR
jgi:hypothetical protein